MLSVVIASRNDDHGGQMIARTNTHIRALAAQARKHKVPVELILVEWNPPEDTPGLIEALTWPHASLYFCARVITVSPEIHNLMGNSDKLDFYQMVAKNVGIRRARYPWVLATNPDLIYSDRIFNALKGELDPTCFYRAVRADIGLRTLDDSLSVPEQLELCSQNVVRVHKKPGNRLLTGACGDFTLMAKKEWVALRGYTEFDKWSIHVDTVFLYWADYHGYRQHLIPDAPCYHMEHYGAWVTNPEYGEGKPKLSSATAYTHQREMHEGKFRHNKADWGLAGMLLPDHAVSGTNAARYADLTLYTVPKSFAGPAGQVQRNALGSWQALRPRPHIVLIGNAPGVAEYALKHRLENIPEVATNKAGTPTLDGILGIIQDGATKHVALVNADIILFQDFMEALDALDQGLAAFLMMGKRTNCQIDEPLDFSTAAWKTDLRRRAEAQGTLHSAGALDYFVFQRGAYGTVPAFAIGRTAWDNWLAANTKAGVFVVDVSLAVLAVHQDHPGAYGADGEHTRSWAFNGAEAKANRSMAKGHKLGSLHQAQGLLTADLELRARVGHKLPALAASVEPLPPGSRVRRGYVRLPATPKPKPQSIPVAKKGCTASPPPPEPETRRGYSRPTSPARVPAPRPMLPTTYVRSKDRKRNA